MKKLIGIVAISLLALIGCSSNDNSTEGSDSDYTIRVPLLGSDSNFVNQSYGVFKENIEERTDGKISVEIYGSGTLAPAEEQQMEMVADGGAEMTSIASGIITNHADAKSFGVFDIPFMFTSDEDLYTYLDSDIIEDLYAELEDKRSVKVLGSYDMKGYNMFNKTRKIETPDDMKGLKIRTSPIDLQVDLLKELGASPTPMAYGETFTALQQGTIDGIHIATGLGWTDKFYEVSEYLTLTRHVALVHFIMINDEFLESLPDDLKEVVLEEAGKLEDEARKQAIETDEKALKEIKESGVEVTELSESEFDVFRDASKDTIDKAVQVIGDDQYKEVQELIGK